MLGDIERSKIWHWKRYLEGLRYPAVKEDILVKARRMNAPAEMIDLLLGSPERRYEKVEEVLELIEALDVRRDPEGR